MLRYIGWLKFSNTRPKLLWTNLASRWRHNDHNCCHCRYDKNILTPRCGVIFVTSWCIVFVRKILSSESGRFTFHYASWLPWPSDTNASAYRVIIDSDIGLSPFFYAKSLFTPIWITTNWTIGSNYRLIGGTKRSWHSRRMCDPQFYVSGKRPITCAGDRIAQVQPGLGRVGLGKVQ